MDWFFGYSAIIESWTKAVFYSAIFLFLVFCVSYLSYDTKDKFLTN